MKRILGAALITWLSLGVVSAQEKSNPVSDAVKALLQSRSQSLLSTARQVPANRYGVPNPADRASFAHLLVHIVESNEGLCSEIAGATAPARSGVTEADAKDKLVDAVQASFDHCAKVLATVDDSKLAVMVTTPGGKKVSRAAAMIELTNHWSESVMYLRLELPPLPPPPAKK